MFRRLFASRRAVLRAAAVSVVPKVQQRAFLTSPALLLRLHDSSALAPFGFRGLFDSPFFSDPIAAAAAPEANVREGEKQLLLELEVPRYKPDDIKVAFNERNGVVTVTGKRTPPNEQDAGFDHLLYSSAPMTSFERSFRFDPEFYDIGKAKWSVNHGVFSLLMPKREVAIPPPAPPTKPQEPARVAVPAGGAATPATTATTAPATTRGARGGELTAPFRFSKWPPAVKVDESAAALTYKCQLPPGVTQDHIKLELYGRSLVLTVSYNVNRKTEFGEQTESASYSTSFRVPQGTTPGDVHTVINDSVLTVSLDKHEVAPKSIPVKENKK